MTGSAGPAARARRFDDGLVLFDPLTWETLSLGADMAGVFDFIVERLPSLPDRELEARELQALLDDGAPPDEVFPEDPALTGEEVALVRKLVRCARAVAGR